MRSFTRIVLAITVSSIAALSVAQTVQKPKFEVASVKPSAPNAPSSLDASPGRFIARAQPLNTVIALAYDIKTEDIVSAPDWVGFTQWDIEAKVEEGSIPPRVDRTDRNSLTPMQFMLQTLLEDRFQLVAHRENRAEPAYDLVVSKSGPKFKRSDDQILSTLPSDFRPFDPTSPQPQGSVRTLGAPRPGGIKTVVGKAVNLWMFAGYIHYFVDRPVVDKTGLTGLFDFEVRFMSEPPPGWPPDLIPKDEGLPAPSIFVALQEQLGLSLQSNAKAPRPVLVIDRVQRASSN
jgi:uncharacterized protein (TIGR03435 family)